jgi:hypothetical protein
VTAQLLGVTPVDLETCLTKRIFQGGNRSTQYSIPLTLAQAEESRDALAKVSSLSLSLSLSLFFFVSFRSLYQMFI